MFWIFGLEARGILTLRPGIKPATVKLEGAVLTPRLPGKSWVSYFKIGLYTN